MAINDLSTRTILERYIFGEIDDDESVKLRVALKVRGIDAGATYEALLSLVHAIADMAGKAHSNASNDPSKRPAGLDDSGGPIGK